MAKVYMTIEDAAAACQVDTRTIRRWIKAGKLEAEQAQRPQGVVWRVAIDPENPPAPAKRGPRKEQPGVLSSHVDNTLTPFAAGGLVNVDSLRDSIMAKLGEHLAAQEATNETLRDGFAAMLEELRGIREEQRSIREELQAQREAPAPEPFWRRVWRRRRA